MTGFVCDLDHDALPFRYCATKGCTWTDDATPPLVAASPVPPVVPDSDALADQIPASMPQDGLHWYRRWLVAQQQLDAKFQREVSNGSGVVPDSDPLDLIERLENPTGDRCQARKFGGDRRCVRTSGHGNGHDFLPDDDEGSGVVVPDKPALAPEKCPVCFGTGVQHCGMSGANCRAGDDGPGGNCGQPCACRNASVPAVTDDEAATQALASALHRLNMNDLDGAKCDADCPDDTGAKDDAGYLLAALRSAGFLIVHHTKET